MLGLHQECPKVVKLVMELHHVSQVGKQGELLDGGASVWASPCKFRSNQGKIRDGGASMWASPCEFQW